MKAKKKSTVKSKAINCRPTFKISKAGHLLSTNHHSRSGTLLATEAKRNKQKRKAKGCLNGTTFQLSAKQKKNLPIALQKAIIKHHRKNGKKIID